MEKEIKLRTFPEWKSYLKCIRFTLWKKKRKKIQKQKIVLI